MTAIALLTSRNLEEFGGRVSNSGEGRHANAAIESVATPVKSYKKGRGQEAEGFYERNFNKNFSSGLLPSLKKELYR
ncbi:MAG: hypothetical protein V7L27_01805 [Nostoc sp.]|uniref:hypothetical protein n=1 Tax=Nostoc sp. TaxID=1180 RepID=UPI002FF49915